MSTESTNTCRQMFILLWAPSLPVPVCMWFLKSLNNKFSTKRGKSPHCTAFVWKAIAKPLLLSSSLNWPQGVKKRFWWNVQHCLSMECLPSRNAFCASPQDWGFWETPVWVFRSYLTTLPACQQHLFGEVCLSLLSHSKSRSAIFFFFFHLTIFLWS